MREAEELSRVIGDIYDASLDPALWPTAIESICGYVGAASASLHSQDSISKATDALFWWGRAPSAPHYFETYLQKYGKINPVFPGVNFFRRRAAGRRSRCDFMRGICSHALLSRMACSAEPHRRLVFKP